MNSDHSHPDRLHESYLGSNEIRQSLGANAQVRFMLEIESALAYALFDAGLVDKADADIIATQCNPDHFDLHAIAREVERSGNPAIPLVMMLTDTVAAVKESAAKNVHLGATSQDVIDTATVLQSRDALQKMDAVLREVINTLAKTAQEFRMTPMAGRTLMQQAAPITFGAKVAGWLEGVLSSRKMLRSARNDFEALQFGGAVGTLAALGGKADNVADALSRRLNLRRPASSWHTERSRVAHLGSALAIATGAFGKIAQDIVFLMQTEIGEVREFKPAGGGGSSAMPHKRNPVDAIAIIAAAQKTPHLAATLIASTCHEHERAAGRWHAEWDALANLLITAGGAAERSLSLVSNLAIDTARMTANLECNHGLVLSEVVMSACTPKIGRRKAKSIVTTAVAKAIDEGISLKTAMLQIDLPKEISDHAFIDDAFDLKPYLQAAAHKVDLILARLDESGEQCDR